MEDFQIRSQTHLLPASVVLSAAGLQVSISVCSLDFRYVPNRDVMLRDSTVSDGHSWFTMRSPVHSLLFFSDY